jgi:uncharacterized protein YlxW (UPF0749 family)
MGRGTHAGGHRRGIGWQGALVLVVAGLLFTTSARLAHGTNLRTDRPDAVALARSWDARVQEAQERVGGLNAQVLLQTDAESKVNTKVAALQREGRLLAPGMGLDAVTGSGYEVTLDDAPHDGPLKDGVSPDDVVVHQQDVQAVVNALWAGGAEAMMLMDQRVISTSAVRCVGNTLLLQGRVYSPPFRIRAIGDPQRLGDALRASRELQIYQQYVAPSRLGCACGARAEHAGLRRHHLVAVRHRGLVRRRVKPVAATPSLGAGWGPWPCASSSSTTTTASSGRSSGTCRSWAPSATSGATTP